MLILRAVYPVHYAEKKRTKKQKKDKTLLLVICCRDFTKKYRRKKRCNMRVEEKTKESERELVHAKRRTEVEMNKTDDMKSPLDCKSK